MTTQTTNKQGTASDRVLAAVTRTPGLNTTELYERLSGVERATIVRALTYLESKGLVRSVKKARTGWYPDTPPQPAPGVLPGPTKNIWTDYVPPKDDTPARSDALAHERAQSRRGDELVPHAKPAGMCVGALADNRSHQAATLRRDSPITGPTFCKPTGMGAVPEPRQTAPAKPATPKPKVAITLPKVALPIKVQKVAFERLHDEETAEKVRKLRAQGLSFSQIAAVVGVSTSWAHRACARVNPDNNRMPPRQKPPKQAINAPKSKKAAQVAGLRT